MEESHGQFAGWLGQAYNPMTVDANPAESGYRVGDFVLPAEISVGRLDRRENLLSAIDRQRRDLIGAAGAAAMDLQYRRAFDLLHSTTGLDAFDVSAEPDAVRDRYGRNAHGQTVLQATLNLERGVAQGTVVWQRKGIKNV